MSWNPFKRRIVKRGWAGLMANPVEIVTALVLSASGVMISWSALQAGLWDGEQAANYARAGAARMESARAANEAIQLSAVDVQLFTAWLEAYARNEERLQQFYRTRFRAEFKPAFEAWAASTPTDRPPTPFASPLYRVAAKEKAAVLERRAGELFERGQRDNKISDTFLQVTVVLSMAMFFAGITQIFKLTPLRVALAAVGVAFCLVGLIRVLSLPAQAWIL